MNCFLPHRITSVIVSRPTKKLFDEMLTDEIMDFSHWWLPLVSINISMES